MKEIREIQAASLSERIRQIELVLKQGASAGLEFLLKGELLNQQAQLADLREDAAKFDVRKEEKSREHIQIAAVVAAETKLSEQEKAQYGEFLQKDFFTRGDFESLDKFYTTSWDKLTDSGKAEMSHRVWEGIRQEQYTFDELPETVKKKESELLYKQLSGQAPASSGIERIPEKDRQDFLQAYDDKNEDAVEEVLARKEIKENVGKSNAVDATSTRSSGMEAKRESGELGTAENHVANTETLLVAFNEEGVSPTDLPNAGGARVR